VVTAFVVVAADVAEKTLVLIVFVAGACATKVNERFIRHCEILFRSHGLERNAMDEDN
jgi:hypothetical protein